MNAAATWRKRSRDRSEESHTDTFRKHLVNRIHLWFLFSCVLRDSVVNPTLACAREKAAYNPVPCAT